MTPTAPQDYISAACEEDLREHGDSFRGVGYTKSADEAQERYALMLEVIRERDTEITLLDLGCGLAHMLDHIERRPDLAASGTRAATSRPPTSRRRGSVTPTPTWMSPTCFARTRASATTTTW